MESLTLELHQANDAEDSYALWQETDTDGSPLAQRGYGTKYQKIWSVEVQSRRRPDLLQVDWEAVLERIIEAYDLNDPVLTDYDWPLRQPV